MWSISEIPVTIPGYVKEHRQVVVHLTCSIPSYRVLSIISQSETMTRFIVQNRTMRTVRCLTALCIKRLLLVDTRFSYVRNLHSVLAYRKLWTCC